MKVYKDTKGFYADPYIIVYNGDVYTTDGRGYMPDGIFTQICEAKDLDYGKVKDDCIEIPIDRIDGDLRKTMEYCLGINFTKLINL